MVRMKSGGINFSPSQNTSTKHGNVGFMCIFCSVFRSAACCVMALCCSVWRELLVLDKFWLVLLWSVNKVCACRLRTLAALAMGWLRISWASSALRAPGTLRLHIKLWQQTRSAFVSELSNPAAVKRLPWRAQLYFPRCNLIYSLLTDLSKSIKTCVCVCVCVTRLWHKVIDQEVQTYEEGVGQILK